MGLPNALQCTDCGYIYGKGKQTMKTFNVYVEDTNGNYLDDYTLEAENEDHAYDLAYERHNYKPLTIYVDEDTDVANKQQYSLGDNPLDKFPSIWSTSK